MSDYYHGDGNSSSSSSSNRSYDDKGDREEKTNYSLHVLREFLARKRYYIRNQFVSDGTVVFVKVHVESIGEDILIYFPSKYEVPKESGLSSAEIVPYELTEKDLLSLQDDEERETKENYNELQIDDITDKTSFADDVYKPISIDNNSENIVRKTMVRYTNQLNKFRNCTAHIKYKFSILSNSTLCVINRHNDVECYLIKDGGTLVQNIIDTKTDYVVPIAHEFYITIDLPSFYEKINQVPDDLIKVHRNFYATLGRAHTKHTVLVEHRFKNYQSIITKLMCEYTKNSKYLDLMNTLTETLERSIQQEDVIVEKMKIISEQTKDGGSTVTKDTEKSFKLSKQEQDLQRVREVKLKTGKLLHEIKTRYHSFLLKFDSALTDTCINLKHIESGMADIGITADKLIKKY